MLYQLSYEATHWEQGQFIEFISSRAVRSCEIYMKLKSLYPPPEGKCGRFYRFDIRNIDIANWDRPWLSELDVTSGISEIKLLISDFSNVDFRFSGIAICNF